MSDKLRCEIVQDLLPSYVDGLTSDETNEAIKDHLADCVSCRDMYERMKADETSAEENSEVMEKEKKEINFLKKIKQKHRLNLMLVVVILTVFFAAVYYHQTYQKGEEMSADEIDYSLQWNSNDSQLNILGNFKNANRGYTRLIGEEDEDGITHLKIYSSPVGSRHPNQFVAGYSKVNAADQVWLGDRIIWDQGENISKMTSDLYQAKTPYAGDAVAVKTLADTVGVGNHFGAYHISLETSEEPYDCQFIIQYPMKGEKKEKALEQMKKDACVMLALVDNLGSVSWGYMMTAEDNNGVETLQMTAEEASAYVGKNIKTCGESPKALQEMLTHLDFITDDGFYVVSGTERDENYNFKVVIYHSQQVDMDGLDCGFGFESRIGTVCSSVMYWEQEEHPEQTVITVSPDRFNRTLTDEEVSKLTLSVAVRDTSGEWHEVCEALPLHAKYGDLLKYTLEENSEDGYSLKKN